jgi:hypothetical protein
LLKYLQDELGGGHAVPMPVVAIIHAYSRAFICKLCYSMDKGIGICLLCSTHGDGICNKFRRKAAMRKWCDTCRAHLDCVRCGFCIECEKHCMFRCEQCDMCADDCVCAKCQMCGETFDSQDDGCKECDACINCCNCDDQNA